MKPKLTFLVRLAFVSLVMGPSATLAQEHRATHLGNPATRFADPLTSPEDLRARFRDERLRRDIAAVLEQYGWKGQLEDLLRAAATARITEVAIAPGTQLPFMSSRKQGRPVALRDVLWDGRESVSAYAFLFTSNGRRYRCLTPKPCSNFLVIDLGPVRSRLELELKSPSEIGPCEPIELRVLVRNAGDIPLTQVRVVDDLPTGLRTTDNRTNLTFDLGGLRVGEVRELRYQVAAASRGTFTHTVRAISAEGGSDQASARLVARMPVVSLECLAPAEIPIGQPVELCLSVRNDGDAPETLNLSLPLPSGATVANVTGGGALSRNQILWRLPDLGPGDSRQVCATFLRSDPGSLAFVASATGRCAPPVQATCETRFTGVPGILLEVVDVKDPVEVGKEVTYEIRITNQGSAALTNVRPLCTMPEIQEFISASGATPARSDGRTLTLEPVASLDPKATAAWHVRLRAQAPGNASFDVRLSCDQLPREFGENETTNQY